MQNQSNSLITFETQLTDRYNANANTNTNTFQGQKEVHCYTVHIGRQTLFFIALTLCLVIVLLTKGSILEVEVLPM